VLAPVVLTHYRGRLRWLVELPPLEESDHGHQRQRPPQPRPRQCGQKQRERWARSLIRCLIGIGLPGSRMGRAYRHETTVLARSLTTQCVVAAELLPLIGNDYCRRLSPWRQ
jgi:hypothetical protein